MNAIHHTHLKEGTYHLYNNRRIKLKLKGLSPFQHRTKSLQQFLIQLFRIDTKILIPLSIRTSCINQLLGSSKLRPCRPFWRWI
ncbi:IS3 family transposase [Streptococcus dentasini]